MSNPQTKIGIILSNTDLSNQIVSTQNMIEWSNSEEEKTKLIERLETLQKQMDLMAEYQEAVAKRTKAVEAWQTAKKDNSISSTELMNLEYQKIQIQKETKRLYSAVRRSSDKNDILTKAYQPISSKILEEKAANRVVVAPVAQTRRIVVENEKAPIYIPISKINASILNIESFTNKTLHKGLSLLNKYKRILLMGAGIFGAYSMAGSATIDDPTDNLKAFSQPNMVSVENSKEDDNLMAILLNVDSSNSEKVKAMKNLHKSVPDMPEDIKIRQEVLDLSIATLENIENSNELRVEAIRVLNSMLKDYYNLNNLSNIDTVVKALQSASTEEMPEKATLLEAVPLMANKALSNLQKAGTINNNGNLIKPKTEDDKNKDLAPLLNAKQEQQDKNLDIFLNKNETTPNRLEALINLDFTEEESWDSAVKVMADKDNHIGLRTHAMEKIYQALINEEVNKISPEILGLAFATMEKMVEEGPVYDKGISNSAYHAYELLNRENIQPYVSEYLPEYDSSTVVISSNDNQESIATEATEVTADESDDRPVVMTKEVNNDNLSDDGIVKDPETGFFHKTGDDWSTTESKELEDDNTAGLFANLSVSTVLNSSTENQDSTLTSEASIGLGVYNLGETSAFLGLTKSTGNQGDVEGYAGFETKIFTGENSEISIGGLLNSQLGAKAFVTGEFNNISGTFSFFHGERVGWKYEGMVDLDYSQGNQSTPIYDSNGNIIGYTDTDVDVYTNQMKVFYQEVTDVVSGKLAWNIKTSVAGKNVTISPYVWGQYTEINDYVNTEGGLGIYIAGRLYGSENYNLDAVMGAKVNQEGDAYFSIAAKISFGEVNSLSTVVSHNDL